MRKANYLNKYVLLLLAVFFFRCTKDSNNSNNNFTSSAPTAQPVNDSKSGGLYKGTITGSTGNFYLNLQNGDNKMYAIVDGVKDTLSTATTITSGIGISQAVFTGHTGMILNFSVNADGSNPMVNSFTIPGHAFAEAFIFKETSTQSVMVFEGRFTKTGGGSSCESGMLNFIIVNDVSGYGYYKEDGGQHVAGTFSGMITSSQFTFSAGVARGNCTINTNKTMITGTASDISGCASSISSSRTL